MRLGKQLAEILERSSSRIIGETILESCCRRCAINREDIKHSEQGKLLSALQRSVTLFVREETRASCIQEIEAILEGGRLSSASTSIEKVIAIEGEDDIVVARSTGRTVCEQLGFSRVAQAKVATIISELARNIFQYAGTGAIKISTENSSRPGIRVIAEDKGPGIKDLPVILAGQYVSRTGMGKGLFAAKKMMDLFDVISTPESGTWIKIVKYVE